MDQETLQELLLKRDDERLKEWRERCFRGGPSVYEVYRATGIPTRSVSPNYSTSQQPDISGA